MEIIIARICVFLAIWKAPSHTVVPAIPTAQLCGESSGHDYDYFHLTDESTEIPWELQTQVSLEGTPMSLGFLGKCCDSWAHSLLVPPCLCSQVDSWVTVQHLEPGCSECMSYSVICWLILGKSITCVYSSYWEMAWGHPFSALSQ